ncbi:hypothetical protein PoB_005882800 [Plakobranchus ocellatus]|uniref:Uncharacterized protein n=1 Tax=Plakobranchus ocellatus TaxID=259542 RepID=A0AAV4CM48_9GAST|nr:hypothetical protein PoB_005882800 [Plakobranchus ocellatus]
MSLCIIKAAGAGVSTSTTSLLIYYAISVKPVIGKRFSFKMVLLQENILFLRDLWRKEQVKVSLISSYFPFKWDIGGVVDSEPTLRSAGTPSSIVGSNPATIVLIGRSE